LRRGVGFGPPRLGSVRQNWVRSGVRGFVRWRGGIGFGPGELSSVARSWGRLVGGARGVRAGWVGVGRGEWAVCRRAWGALSGGGRVWASRDWVRSGGNGFAPALGPVDGDGRGRGTPSGPHGSSRPCDGPRSGACRDGDPGRSSGRVRIARSDRA